MTDDYETPESDDASLNLPEAASTTPGAPVAAAVEEPVVDAVEEIVESLDAAGRDEAAEAPGVEAELDEIVEVVEPALGDAELIEVEAIDDGARARYEQSPFERPGRWYVVHTYAGYENKVKQNLASRVRSMGVEEQIFEVAIPMETVIEFKGGKKQEVQKKVFPGYLLVRMDLDDNSWYVVRNTPGVTGFVGLGARPTPLTRKEVENILQVKAEEGEGTAAGRK